MKKFVLWLIRVFKLDISAEKIVEKTVEKVVYLPKDGVMDGDITIKGNVTVTGRMQVTGNLKVYAKED